MTPGVSALTLAHVDALTDAQAVEFADAVLWWRGHHPTRAQTYPVPDHEVAGGVRMVLRRLVGESCKRSRVPETESRDLSRDTPTVRLSKSLQDHGEQPLSPVDGV